MECPHCDADFALKSGLFAQQVARIAELEAALGRLWDVATTVERSGKTGCFVPEAEWRRAMSAHPAFAGGQSEGHPAAAHIPTD